MKWIIWEMWEFELFCRLTCFKDADPQVIWDVDKDFLESIYYAITYVHREFS